MKRAAIALCAAALVGAAMSIGAIPAAAAGAPYTDPARSGSIGFCDSAGHNVASGSIDAVPFVAKAVSAVAAGAPYNRSGRVAFINAYQPRQGVTPAEWSGEQLISSTAYHNPAHPTAVGTRGDISLAQFVSDFPANWDGFVQLRMYLESANTSYDPMHYVTADLQISGNQWRAVDSAQVPCSAARAVSLARVLAPAAAAGKYQHAVGHSNRTGTSTGTANAGGPHQGHAAGQPAGGIGGQSGPSAGHGVGANGPAVSPGTADPSPAAAHGASNAGPPIGTLVLIALIVALSIALGYAYRRDLLRMIRGERNMTT